MRCSWFVLVVGLLTGCRQDGSASGSALEACTGEVAAAKREVERLTMEVSQLKADTARLKATEEGVWAEATAAHEAQQFELARTRYRDFETRFPTSVRLSALSVALGKLDALQCSSAVEAASTTLESSDRDAIEEVERRLRDDPVFVGMCKTKESRARIGAMRQKATAILARWPSPMSPTEYKARHVEMKGKRALITGKLTQSDYFNFGYMDAETLRSFKIEKESWPNDLSVYCERGPRCDALFEKTLASDGILGEWVVENSLRHYNPHGDGMGMLILSNEP